jgi:hypothetical protein
MKKLFMSKVLDYVKQAVVAGDIVMSGNLEKYADEKVFKGLMNMLYKKKWVVYVKQPFAGPAAVVSYLGNYTHRTAISEHRLVAQDEKTVSFRYKDYTDDSKIKIMTVDSVEFIRRFMLHILPKGFMRIRHYGFLSSRGRQKQLPKCALIFASLRDNLAKKQTAQKKPWYEYYREKYGRDPRACKKCGAGIMARTEIIKPMQIELKGVRTL